MHEGAAIADLGYLNAYEVGVTELIGYKATMSFYYVGKSDVVESDDHRVIPHVDDNYEYTAPFGSAHTLYFIEHGMTHGKVESEVTVEIVYWYGTLSPADGV